MSVALPAEGHYVIFSHDADIGIRGEGATEASSHEAPPVAALQKRRRPPTRTSTRSLPLPTPQGLHVASQDFDR